MFPATEPPLRTAGGLRAALRRAVDVAIAFATLEDGDEPAVAPAAHPHRRPLRAPARTRRPGAARARPQDCTTPLLTRPPRSARQHASSR
jgi:hypothetical protein